VACDSPAYPENLSRIILTLTVSPMLYQMLRTKFSSIHGSSSPILRLSAAVSVCAQAIVPRHRIALRARVGGTHQRVVLPALDWPSPPALPGGPMLPWGGKPLPEMSICCRSGCEPDWLGCSPWGWPWNWSYCWKLMFAVGEVVDRAGGVVIGGRKSR